MITRRTLLALLGSIPGLALVKSPDYVVVGPMTLERERMLAARGVKVRVMCDGVDVTKGCQFADDTPGHQVASVLRRDANGRFHIDYSTREVAKDTLTGDVRILLERQS